MRALNSSGLVSSGLMAVVLFCCTSPLYAEAPTVDEIIVSTADRTDRAASTASGSIAQLSAEELRALQATHISEVANRLAGVSIHRNNGQEYLASIRSPILTGAGACSAFLTAQDSVPLRAAGFCNVNELFEAFTETASRIEVTKGPGSALYGSNALHGIVNVITPSALEDDSYAALELGSYEYARLNFSAAVSRSETSGLRLYGSLSHDGGYRDDSGFNQQKLAVRHAVERDSWSLASTIAFTRLDQETAGFITGLDAYKDRGIAKTNPNPEAFRKATSLRASSTYSRDLGDSMRLQSTPYFRHLDMEFLMHFLPGQPLEENGQTSIGIQNGLYIGEGSDFEIITGLDAEYTDSFLKQTQENPTEGSAFLQATIPAGKQYDYDVKSLMAAGFLQLAYEATERLRLTAGVRLEHMRYDYRNNMNSGRVDEDGNECGFGGCRYSRPESNVNSFTSFSPKAGLVYSFTSSHQLFANIGAGYRAPQATELYRLQREQTVADLENVKLFSIDGGMRGGDTRFSYTISAYYMRKKNYIFRDSSFFNVNDGRSTHQGIELAASAALTGTLRLSANGSLAKHTYDFDYMSGGINLMGNDIDTAPRHFGSAQLKWTPTVRLSAELEWVHMGSYYLDPENLHEYGGHDYLNLRAGYQLRDGLKLGLRIMNITNVKYAERADYTAFTDERYFPGKPTTVFASLEVRF